MIYREIVRTCSNPHVAEAAVLSIGGSVALAVRETAERHDMGQGAFAAQLVRDFAKMANSDDELGVLAATHLSEQPILSGLRYILARGVGTVDGVMPRI